MKFFSFTFLYMVMLFFGIIDTVLILYFEMDYVSFFWIAYVFATIWGLKLSYHLDKFVEKFTPNKKEVGE